MAEFECPNLKHVDKSGLKKCMLHVDDLKRRDQEIETLKGRLRNAKEVFARLKPVAEREERLDDALRAVYDRLRRIRVTRGSDVAEVREDLDRAKKMILDALRS